MIEETTIDLITKAVAQFGFPIIMVFYLMFKFEKSLNKNTDAVNNLTVFLNGNKKR